MTDWYFLARKYPVSPYWATENSVRNSLLINRNCDKECLDNTHILSKVILIPAS